MSDAAPKSSKKQQALSKALKANMAKRKAQARALQAEPKDQEPRKEQA